MKNIGDCNSYLCMKNSRLGPSPNDSKFIASEVATTGRSKVATMGRTSFIRAHEDGQLLPHPPHQQMQLRKDTGRHGLEMGGLRVGRDHLLSCPKHATTGEHQSRRLRRLFGLRPQNARPRLRPLRRRHRGRAQGCRGTNGRKKNSNCLGQAKRESNIQVHANEAATVGM